MEFLTKTRCGSLKLRVININSFKLFSTVELNLPSINQTLQYLISLNPTFLQVETHNTIGFSAELIISCLCLLWEFFIKITCLNVTNTTFIRQPVLRFIQKNVSKTSVKFCCRTSRIVKVVMPKHSSIYWSYGISISRSIAGWNIDRINGSNTSNNV